MWWQRVTRKGQDARNGELQNVKKPRYSSGTERVRRGQKEQLSGKLELKRIRNKTWDSTESLWQQSPRCPSEPEQLISCVHVHLHMGKNIYGFINWYHYFNLHKPGIQWQTHTHSFHHFRNKLNNVSSKDISALEVENIKISHNYLGKKKIETKHSFHLYKYEHEAGLYNFPSFFSP